MTGCPAETEKWEYVNGEMDRPEAEAFEAHLDRCPACRAEMAGLKDVALKLAEIPRPEAPAAFVEAAKKALGRAALSVEPRPENRSIDEEKRFSRRENAPTCRLRQCLRGCRVLAVVAGSWVQLLMIRRAAKASLWRLARSWIAPVIKAGVAGFPK